MYMGWVGVGKANAHTHPICFIDRVKPTPLGLGRVGLFLPSLVAIKRMELVARLERERERERLLRETGGLLRTTLSVVWFRLVVD